MTEVTFPDIDTSYWHTKDKDWMAERQAQWLTIETMLDYKTNKAKTILKQYFLKGKMPNWEKLSDWDEYTGHLDLFTFLWLHPSWDESVLKGLRDAYMASDSIMLRDLSVGFGSLFDKCMVLASDDYEGKKNPWIPYTDGHNELLFNIMMGDDNQRSPFKIARKFYYGESRIFEFPKSDLFNIHIMGRWLCIEKMTPINNDFLYQYDAPLQWWYESAQKEDYFRTCSQRENTINSVKKALWRIQNFDTRVVDENDPRIDFVRKMKKILDERSFDKEFEAMWVQVKAGEVEVDKPWKR